MSTRESGVSHVPDHIRQEWEMQQIIDTALTSRFDQDPAVVQLLWDTHPLVRKNVPLTLEQILYSDTCGDSYLAQNLGVPESQIARMARLVAREEYPLEVTYRSRRDGKTRTEMIDSIGHLSSFFQDRLTDYLWVKAGEKKARKGN